MLGASTTGNNITASYNPATYVLNLTGTDTLAHYQQVLDSVQYASTSQNPTSSGADPSRTVSWVVNDGSANSPTQTTTVTTTAGSPPALSGVGTSAFCSADRTGTTLSPGTTVSDPDSVNLV